MWEKHVQIPDVEWKIRVESGRAGSCAWVCHMPALSLHHPTIKVTHSCYRYKQLIEHSGFNFTKEQKQILKPQSSHVAELLSHNQVMFPGIFPGLTYFSYCLP